MKIIKHCSQTFPTTATGFLVGMDVQGTLQATNAFPFPTVDVPHTDGHNHESAASNIAAAAPRAKSNGNYQNEMIRNLREVNVDANNVGWYTSANMGNFVNLNLIENQYHYQKEMNERTIAIVHDVSKSSQGSLSLRAFRLSPTFMAAFKENKFTTERYGIICSERAIKLIIAQPSKEQSETPRHAHGTTPDYPQLTPPDFVPPPTSFQPSYLRARPPCQHVRTHIRALES
jgi:hypothetical protein